MDFLFFFENLIQIAQISSTRAHSSGCDPFPFRITAPLNFKPVFLSLGPLEQTEAPIQSRLDPTGIY
ncbi:unnamed protein product [Allacma fusca]|uniref:Uncharacterized protein n=1 Tax=Allacma fusca TaxID=39272 RepID=A0A8J2PNT3_9HEXA|nr:unnamed protein product [Allacma fusca]